MTNPNSDSHGTFEAEAASIVAQLFHGARSKLQHAFPYMSSVAIERMLDKSARDLEDAIHAQEQAMNASKARCDFLKLPAELRTYIYELALPEDKVQRPGDPDELESDHVVNIQKWECTIPGDTGRVIHPSTQRPSLLGVSKQVRQEALPIYYSVNVFIASYDAFLVNKLPRWLARIGTEQAAMIKKLVIHFYTMDAEDVNTQILNIKTIKIRWANEGRAAMEVLHKKDVVEWLRIEGWGVKNGALQVMGNWLENVKDP